MTDPAMHRYLSDIEKLVAKYELRSLRLGEALNNLLRLYDQEACSREKKQAWEWAREVLFDATEK